MIRLLKNQRGSIVSTELLLYIVIFIGGVFAVVDYWAILTQFNQAELIKNKYLDIARLNGYLSETNKQGIETAFNDIGLVVTEISVTDKDGVTVDSAHRLSRSISYTDISDLPVIKLSIKGNFNRGPLLMSLFTGASQDELTFDICGDTFVEYIE